eukprot:GILK01003294.1.p1 GENE.GILK01003294.1~~GILK01003294.1.p1  ORF type:complete len:160 (-),score=25.33 GILK01003294.1:113-550(-)
MATCDYRSRKCRSCETDSSIVAYSREEAAVHLRELGDNDWELTEDGKSIRRSFTAKNFAAAMTFLQAVGNLAESEGHHPDMHLTSYRNVELVLYTHAKGGVTENDLILAAKIDQLPVEYSPKWLKDRNARKQSSTEHAETIASSA